MCIYLQIIQTDIQLNQQQIKACESAFTEHVFIVLLKGMFLIRGERIPMITHDELTDMMAARLSKGEDLDLIYTNPKNHIVCFIPTYEPGGGDSTKCYFVDGREELVCLPMRTITRELALQEGLRPNYIMTSDGRCSSYTSPKTYGPHLTFAHIKCRVLSAKTWCMASLTWLYPMNISLRKVRNPIRAIFMWGTLNRFWCTNPHVTLNTN